MRTLWLTGLPLAALLAAILMLPSCDGRPETPTGPFRGGLARIEIIGPATLAPGATARLQVVAHRASGTTEDVTSAAIFRSSAPDVVVIAPGAVARAVGHGESSVTAAFQTFNATREIVVVPEGTFRVTGHVFEDGMPGTGLAGARIEVAGGEPSTVTELQGFYRLYGVPPQARLRVSRNGYLTRELTLDISDHHRENIALAPDRARVDPTGTYEMTIEVSPTCRGRIPDVLLTRRYTADLTLNGRHVAGTLRGATFAPGGNIVRGSAEAAHLILKFEFDYYHYYGGGADLIEIVDEQTYLVVWTSNGASVMPSERGFSGLFAGAMFIYDRHPREVTSERASCYASDHRLSLVR